MPARPPQRGCSGSGLDPQPSDSGVCEQVELARRDASPTAGGPVEAPRHRQSRQSEAGLAVEHGTDDPGAIAMAEHVRGVRPGPQDLLHQWLAHAHIRQGCEQTGEARHLDAERLELDHPLLPDLAHGSGAGVRERVRRRLCHRIGHERRDHPPIDDVVGREHCGGKLVLSDRHGARQRHRF